MGRSIRNKPKGGGSTVSDAQLQTKADATTFVNLQTSVDSQMATKADVSTVNSLETVVNEKTSITGVQPATTGDLIGLTIDGTTFTIPIGLNDLLDVNTSDTSAPVNGQALVYNSSNQRWVPGIPSIPVAKFTSYSNQDTVLTLANNTLRTIPFAFEHNSLNLTYNSSSFEFYLPPGKYIIFAQLHYSLREDAFALIDFKLNRRTINGGTSTTQLLHSVEYVDFEGNQNGLMVFDKNGFDYGLPVPAEQNLQGGFVGDQNRANGYYAVSNLLNTNTSSGFVAQFGNSSGYVTLSFQTDSPTVITNLKLYNFSSFTSGWNYDDIGGPAYISLNMYYPGEIKFGYQDDGDASITWIETRTRSGYVNPGSVIYNINPTHTTPHTNWKLRISPKSAGFQDDYGGIYWWAALSRVVMSGYTDTRTEDDDSATPFGHATISGLIESTSIADYAYYFEVFFDSNRTNLGEVIASSISNRHLGWIMKVE